MAGRRWQGEDGREEIAGRGWKGGDGREGMEGKRWKGGGQNFIVSCLFLFHIKWVLTL